MKTKYLLICLFLVSGCKSYFRVETNYASPINKADAITINAKVEGYDTPKNVVLLHEKVVKFLTDCFGVRK